MCGGKAPTVLVGHPGGTIIPPEEVIRVLKQGFYIQRGRP